MKIFFTLITSYLIFSGSAFAQLNMSFVGNLDYPEIVNDIWGYVTPEPHNTEYALMGMNSGTAIISLANPANPVQVAFIPGAPSNWRDIKTWGDRAYISNESGGGIAIVDLSDLPNGNVSFHNYSLPVPNFPPVIRAHNLWVDELGYLYVMGARSSSNYVNAGGVLIFDVFTEPGTPTFVGMGLAVYSHDAYARGNFLYSADIYAGSFSVYDITDRSNPVMLNFQQTDFNFTHNVWLSDDGNTLFTTDEKANAPIGIFNVSDPFNIERLAAFRPTASIGLDVIPHNVHVKDDFVVISHYTDGVVVIDGSRPNNPIEVGVYDTYPNPPGGFFGCWGAYPFLPSGLIIASDRQTGLYVLQPEYERACWLEGNITDAQSGLPVQGATVEILETSGLAESDFEGKYYTGFANAGSFEVLITKIGYYDFTTTVNLNNNVVTMLDVELEPLATPFTLKAKVINSITGQVLENAAVKLVSPFTEYEAISDGSGLFELPGFFEGTYTIYIAKWHFVEIMLNNVQFQVTEDVYTIALAPGYRDGFKFDQGWTVNSTASHGVWLRDVPIGVTFNDALLAPDADMPNDYGNKAWITGNGGIASQYSVQNGYTRLISPSMNLSNYVDPAITFHYWFYRSAPSGDATGAFVVSLYDGIDTVEVFSTESNTNGWSTRQVIRVDDFPVLKSNLQLIVEANQLPNTGGSFLLVEAGFDHFLVDEYDAVNTSMLIEVNHIKLFPNPASDVLNVIYTGDNPEGVYQLEVFNMTGHRMHSSLELWFDNYQINIGHWPSGVYLIRFVNENGIASSLRFIKL